MLQAQLQTYAGLEGFAFTLSPQSTFCCFTVDLLHAEEPEDMLLAQLQTYTGLEEIDSSVMQCITSLFAHCMQNSCNTCCKLICRHTLAWRRLGAV